MKIRKFEKPVFTLTTLILFVLVFNISYPTNSSGDKDCMDIQHPFPYIEIEDRSEAHRLLKPNVSSWVDQGMGGCRIEPYRLETNLKGWRYDEFQEEKPENTTRILVIGDSNVVGWGVNQSYTFSSILERRLNQEEYDKYQVINMGVPGSGIENHFLILENIGIKYDPDLVILSTGDRDSMTIPKQRELRERAEDILSEEDHTEQDIHNEVEKLTSNYWNNYSFEDSVMKDYIDKFENKSEESNFDLCIHFLYPPRDRQTRDYIQAKSEENQNFCFIDKSSVLTEESGEKWQLSDIDPHYNPKAHDVIASNIQENLKK